VYQPVAQTPVITGTAFASFPGIAKSAMSDADFWQWQRRLGETTKQPAVWSELPTWDSITHQPLLPDKVSQPVSLETSRNQTVCAALGLSNTTITQPVTGKVSLGAFHRVGEQDAEATETVRGELRIAGTIISRLYGVNIGPLLTAENMPGASILRKYLTNAPGVARFPLVTLTPGGSVVLWLTVKTLDAAPGTYEAKLRFGDGVVVPVRVTVLDVTLPSPPVWVRTWSGGTGMFPFVYTDRQRREVAYRQSLGITVWGGWPTPRSGLDIARNTGRVIFQQMVVPDKYVQSGYAGQIKPEDLTDDDAKAIADHVAQLVKQAESFGLSYDDWSGELWDEPGAGNAASFGAIAALVRKANPKVRIYCNPSFWIGGGFAQDKVVFDALSPWYRQMVDVSVPYETLVFERPKSSELFDHPRSVRAFYRVATQSAKGEHAAQVELYSRLAWDAFSRGYNGWAFYSYFGPRGNPWDDFDQCLSTGEDMADYQMVYPGPRGPIPTRQSEALRQGWHDYQLLTLLKQQGKASVTDAIIKDYQDGTPLADLRRRALHAAAK
jgi:hypothetical protein